MYITESQSAHRVPTASVIEKKPPQIEALILFGEKKHSRTAARLTDAPCCFCRLLKSRILKSEKAARVVKAGVTSIQMGDCVLEGLRTVT